MNPEYAPPPDYVESRPGVLSSLLSYADNILMALIVLVVGTIIAWLIAAAVKWVFRKTALDDKLARWMQGGTTRSAVNSEQWIGRIVFWLIMLFVLIGVFQALDAPAISDPLNSLLSEILEFIPRLIGAALLLAVAWVVARVVKAGVTRGLQATRLDERVSRHLPASETTPDSSASTGATSGAARRTSLAESLGEAAYWLVFLLFLPMILDVLGLQGILAPLMVMLEEVLDFLPNLFVAAVVLVIGWFVARVVRNVVQGLLSAAGTDRFGADVGLSRATGRYSLSEALAWVVYILILIPVVITALEALQIDAITEPATAMLRDVLLAVPRIIAAAVLLFIAYFVAKLVANVVAGLLEGLGLNRMLANIGLVRSAGAGAVETTADRGHLVELRGSVTEIVRWVIVVVIMLFAAAEALRLLGFMGLAALVIGFLGFLGNVILGLIIIALGLALAQMAARAVRGSGIREADLVARIAQASIAVLAIAMGLREMGLGESIINLAFGLTLGAIAVAAAIAFGLGGRDLAHRKLEQWTREADRAESNLPTTSGVTPSPPPSPEPGSPLEP
jgi:hypothetical protein